MCHLLLCAPWYRIRRARCKNAMIFVLPMLLKFLDQAVHHLFSFKKQAASRMQWVAVLQKAYLTKSTRVHLASQYRKNLCLFNVMFFTQKIFTKIWNRWTTLLIYNVSYDVDLMNDSLVIFQLLYNQLFLRKLSFWCAALV